MYVQATSFDGVFLLVAFHYIALVCNYCFFIVVNEISIYLSTLQRMQPILYSRLILGSVFSVVSSFMGITL